MDNILRTNIKNSKLLKKVKTYKTRLADNITFSSLVLNNIESYKILTLIIGDHFSSLKIDDEKMVLTIGDLESETIHFQWQQSDKIQPPNPECILICNNMELNIMAANLGFLTFYDCFQACLNVSMKISDNEKITETIE